MPIVGKIISGKKPLPHQAHAEKSPAKLAGL